MLIWIERQACKSRKQGKKVPLEVSGCPYSPHPPMTPYELEWPNIIGIQQMFIDMVAFNFNCSLIDRHTQNRTQGH